MHHPLAPHKDNAFSTNSRTMHTKPKSVAMNSMQGLEKRQIKIERKNVVNVEDPEKDKIVSNVPKPVTEPMRSRWSTEISPSINLIGPIGQTSSSFKLPMILEFSSLASEQGNSALFKFGGENTAGKTSPYNTEHDDECKRIIKEKGGDDKEGYKMNGSEVGSVSLRHSENLVNHLANLNNLTITTLPSMSKETFAWCLMTARMTKSSYSHTQLLYLVRRIFKVIGNNFVKKTKACFPSLFNMSTSTLQKYWHSPPITELRRIESMKKHFESLSDVNLLNNSENFIKDILGEDTVSDSHPLLVETSQGEFRAFITAALAHGGAENIELYRFLMEVFTEHDRDEVGELGFTEFSSMIDEVMRLPTKLSVSHEYEDLLQLRKHRQLLFKACMTEERRDQICMKGWIKFAFKEVYKKLI